MFCVGCIFIDHASNHTHIEFQTHLNTHKTLKAKENYEHMCRGFGNIPQSYHTDKGSAFTSADYAKELNEFKQVTTFAGVDAHRHNGKIERTIQTIMAIARTMMLHSAIHWPETTDTSLWPMAVKQAVFLYNHLPDPATGFSPTMYSPKLAGRSSTCTIYTFGAVLYMF